MPSKIPQKIRESVEQRAGKFCEYCLLPETDAHYRHQIDHIFPRKHGGETILENLALACWRCNLYKGSDIASRDTETKNLIGFFNPRVDIWTEHFRLLERGEIQPLSAEARVTIKILRINDAERIEERRELMEAGIYE